MFADLGFPDAAEHQAKLRLAYALNQVLDGHQIWERIAKADLIFCDVTGQNPNVMFESGVCAALKKIEQVVFLRDEFYRPDQPFDIAPFRFVKSLVACLRSSKSLTPRVGHRWRTSSSPSTPVGYGVAVSA